jgi:predicted TIM-barrel fold metal-dependent hydrolase
MMFDEKLENRRIITCRASWESVKIPKRKSPTKRAKTMAGPHLTHRKAVSSISLKRNINGDNANDCSLNPLSGWLLMLITTLLLFTSGCCSPKPAQCAAPPVVIDVHTHLFNADYLPLSAIAVSRGVPPLAADALEGIIKSITSNSDLPRGQKKRTVKSSTMEANRLNELSNMPKPQARTSVIQEIMTNLTEAHLLNVANGTGLKEEQLKALKLYVRTNSSSVRPRRLEAPLSLENIEALTAAPMTPEEIAQAFESAGIMSDSHSTNIVATETGLSGYLRLLRVVISSEQSIFQSLQTTYPQVSLFVHHMMDLEHSYGEEPTFPFQRQVSRMISLQNKNPGMVLTFGAFDPFRRDAALTAATNAYEQGVVGFKFYPPDGYRPAENVIPSKNYSNTVTKQWESRYLNLTANQLNSFNEAFFGFCEARDIPIFVHCTPSGFEAVGGYGGQMADPVYWRSVLKNHPRLRVGFGHSGGTGLWFGQNGDSAGFGDTVAQLCEQYDNVYCDAAYWETMLTDAGVTTLQSNLPKLLVQYPKLSKKLMYGTDWFLITQEDNSGTYLCQMLEAFESPGLKFMKNDFFAGNAACFLKLNELANDSRLNIQVRNKLKVLLKRMQNNATASNADPRDIRGVTADRQKASTKLNAGQFQTKPLKA